MARLRFGEWIDENIFVHEFIHFLDAKRYLNSYMFKTPKNDINYYNSPEEYNAFSSEIINQIIKNKKKMMGLSFEEFIKKSIKFGDENFIKNINDIYLKKLKNRLYKLFVKLNNN